MIGHIYRIIHLESDIQYVGRTFNEPRKRWQAHKASYRDWLSDRPSTTAICPFFHEYGIDTFKLIPIKSYDVCDRQHLEVYEQLWINKLKCINKSNPFYIPKLTKKQYHIDHRDHISSYGKQYRKANRDAIRAKKQLKFDCECGGKYTAAGKGQHLRTKRHQSWLESQQP
jgi:hypothetical protein